MLNLPHQAWLWFRGTVSRAHLINEALDDQDEEEDDHQALLELLEGAEAALAELRDRLER